jgi:hypothetical protein
VADVAVMVGVVVTADAEAMADAFPEPEASVLHDDMVLNILFCNVDGDRVCNTCDALYPVFYESDADAADDEVVPGHKNL